MKTTIRHAAGVMLLALLTLSCSGKSGRGADTGNDADSAAMAQTDGDKTADDATAAAEVPADLKPYVQELETAVRTLVGTYPELDDDFFCISAAVEGKSHAEALQSVGYTLLDIDQNGTQELVIASNAQPGDYPSCKGNMIFLIYDLHDGKPRKIVSGHYRNAWFLSRPDRELLNIGSVSAACSIHALYDYINGELTCRDNWYSGLNEEGDHIFYHSYEATTDPAKGEQLSFTMDDFISHGGGAGLHHREAFQPSLRRQRSDIRREDVAGIRHSRARKDRQGEDARQRRHAGIRRLIHRPARQ